MAHAKSLSAVFGGADKFLSSQNRCFEEVNDNLTLRLCGGIGSPYTNKILALMRFRRIQFRYCIMNSPEELGSADPPVPKAAQRLLPKMLWPDGRATNDSTFIARELEQARHPGTRACRPAHPGIAFLSDLLEDWADEWLTKSMYHFRWTHDADYAGRMIALQQAAGPNAPAALLDAVSSMVQARQVERREVVGSNPATYASIEAGTTVFVELFDAHLAAGHRFLFGSRPSVADFAVFGQLHPMISLDPNTSRRISDQSVRVTSWYNTTSDLSGLSLADEERGWLDAGSPLPPTLRAILREVGRGYVPFMLANAQALAAGSEEVSVVLGDGTHWKQPSFKYQGKCLAWLRHDFAQLAAADQEWVQEALRGTGCEALLADGLGSATRAKL